MTRIKAWLLVTRHNVLQANALWPRPPSVHAPCGTAPRSICGAMRSWPRSSTGASWPIGARCIGCAYADAQLRVRIRRLVLTVPLPLPHFWLAALTSLGDPVDFDAPVPDYYDTTAI